MNKKEIICRLCLKIADCETITVDEVTRQILDVLQINVDIDISKNSAMCNSCSESISRLFAFKSVYVIMEQMLLEFTLRENRGIIDLKEVFKAEKVDTNLDRDKDICRLCMKWNTTADLTLVSTLASDNLFVEMWARYMAEVDLAITKHPKLCFHCKDNTQRYFKFMLDVQTRTQHQDESQPKIYKCPQCTYETHKQRNLRRHTKIHQDRSQLKMHKCPKCNYETHRNSSLRRHDLTHQDRSQLKMYKCLECTYETHRERNLHEHTKVHQERSQLKTIKCLECSYETYRKDYLNRHRKAHHPTVQPSMYKCSTCSFETRRKDTLKKHARIHQDPSELTMYKCLDCSYQTHRKHSMKQHMKIHEDRSQLAMYKCLKCSFETHVKKNLQVHTKTHHPSSTIKAF